MDNDSGILVWVCSCLCRYRVLLVAHGFPNEDVAVLEDRYGVAEDEVYGAVDVAVAVELALGVDVESVLVPLEAATVEHRVVAAGTESHRLVLLWPRRVLEGHVPCHEPISHNRCNLISIKQY